MTDQPRDETGKYRERTRIERWLRAVKRLLGVGDAPPAAGDDGVSLERWVADLTYQEVHATTWGVAIAALAVTTQSAVVASVAAGLLLFAYTGDKSRAKSMGADVPDAVYQQVRRESHYFTGGLAIGAVVGAAALYLGIELPTLAPYAPL